MQAKRIHPTVLRICAWTGPLFTLWWLVGAGPIMDFITLPQSSNVGADEVVGWYTENITAARIGSAVLIFASMIYCCFGAVITLYTRQSEGHRPALFYIQMVSLACCEVVVMLIGFFWGAASWRAGDIDPQITQTLHDLGWLGVLFTGAPFAMYMIALAAAIFLDESKRPAFPRWVAYFNLFVTFWMFEAALILMFKTGPFSQNGLFVFYLPMIVFFAWIVTMSYMTLRAIKHEQAELEAGSPEPAARPPAEPALV